MRPRDTTPESHAVQLDAYRRLGAPGRIRLAEQLSADTRQLTRAGIRARHPEYSEEAVEMALRRVLYGDDLVRRAWPGRPLLAP